MWLFCMVQLNTCAHGVLFLFFTRSRYHSRSLSSGVPESIHARVWVCVCGKTQAARTATPNSISVCVIVFDFYVISPPLWLAFYVWMVCARSLPVCVFPICNFGVLYFVFLFFSFFFLSFNIIYEFYLIFRKRIIRPLNFFFRFFNIISFLRIQFVIT